jgi:uncharacterized protein (TIGR03437 family)
MNLRSRFVLCLSGVMSGLLFAADLYAHAPHIQLSSQYLNFVARPGGPNPPAQTVILTNGTHGKMPWFASINYVTGNNWLTVGPLFGTLPGLQFFESAAFNVTVASSALPAGAYYATITVSAPGDPTVPTPPADNTPQIIEVVLSINSDGQAAPGIGVTSPALDFTGPAASGRSYSLNLGVFNAGQGTLSWSVSADTFSGGNWLSAAVMDANNATITANVGKLAAGVYTGRVILTSPTAANSPKMVPVTLTVRIPLPPAIKTNATALTFTVMSDAGDPPPQTLVISDGGDITLNWKLAATTFNGGAWLTAAPDSGSDDIGSTKVTVAARLGSLEPGTYTGRITIFGDGAVNSPVAVPVKFVVAPPQPVFQAAGVVNAASFRPGPVAPGEIVSLFGSRLGPKDPVLFSLDPNTNKVPTTLAGTQITFDGVPAPLFFVSYGQVNFQVPFEIPGDSTEMTVNVAGYSPTKLSLPVIAASPGIFTVDGVHGAVLNQDNTLNTPDNPAAIGSVVQIFVTGQGPLSSKIATGAPAPASPPFPAPQMRVGVGMDAFSAKVLFAGLAPGLVGLTQINAEVPVGVTPSDHVRLSVVFDTYQSSPVLISVR